MLSPTGEIGRQKSCGKTAASAAMAAQEAPIGAERVCVAATPANKHTPPMQCSGSERGAPLSGWGAADRTGIEEGGLETELEIGDGTGACGKQSLQVLDNL